MALPDAGDRARAARIIARVQSYGVEVRVMPGHETRGFQFPAVPSRVFDHHDASSRKSGEWGSLGLILDGTTRGIPGPLANAQVARCLDGVPRLAWVADGYCYHAGTGGPLHELALNNANPYTYGVEKANDGLGEPYTAAANYATNALFVAMAIESGRVPDSFPIGHKEWTTRKTDPLYSMVDRRTQVAAFNPTGDSFMPNLTEGEQREILALARNFQTGISGQRFAGPLLLLLDAAAHPDLSALVEPVAAAIAAKVATSATGVDKDVIKQAVAEVLRDGVTASV